MENQTKIAAESMRRGFTLVELLVAVAIVGILASIGVSNFIEHIHSTRRTAAKTAVDNISGAVTQWMLSRQKSTPPSDLKVLIEENEDTGPVLNGGEGALIDQWGNDFKIETKGKRYAIVSAGPDGEFGTEDDIRSDKIQTKKK